MADEDVATRAPESDAAEQVSPIPGDSKVDQGSASLGEHCTTDRPTPSGLTPTGELTKYDDIEVYISKPSDYPHTPSKLLLLLTGGTGIYSTNNQIQADKYAEEGFLVIMPDQFAGNPVSATASTNIAGEDQTPSVIEQIKLGIVSAVKSFSIDMWLARHTPEKVHPILDKVLTTIKEEYADSVKHGEGIYVAGYCFGAKYALQLAATLHKDVVAGQRDPAAEAEAGMVKQGPQVKCAVIAHGTVITQEDIENVEVPLSIVAVKDDTLFPDELREAGVKSLREKGREVEEVVYDGVPHGFAVLGDYEETSIKQKQAEAFKQMLEFLKSH